MKHLKLFPDAIGVAILSGPSGWLAVALLFALSFLINPSGLAYVGANVTTLTNAATKASVIALSPDGEEIKWEMDIIGSASAQSPFADNMTGRPGSGKPVISYGATKTVAGQSIVISTDDDYGSPGVQGNGVRNGQGEAIKPGDFLLKTSIWWCGGGADNTSLTQTVQGLSWSQRNKIKIARNLARKQSDDAMFALKHGAFTTTTPKDNVVLPTGKTIDTLGTADTYSYSLMVKSGGVLKDIGAIPMNAARNPDSVDMPAPTIPRFMQFTTDVNARPIKTDSQYLEALKWAADRGTSSNPIFTGEFVDVDGQIPYYWQTVRHGAYAPIGAVIQPEALLGVAIGATTDLSAGLLGGGTAAAAAVTPYPNYFQAFSRMTYTPMNGVTSSFTPRATYGYLAIEHADTKKISLFRYTTNTAAVGSTTANTITGLKRLGPANSGDELTTIGDMTYNSGAWLLAADGNGYAGLGTGVIPINSKIYEVNSKGVPPVFGFGLGEMALVCGFGKVPVVNGDGAVIDFKTMASRTFWQEPHGRAFEEGLQVAYGVTPFLRPDSLAPNYVLTCFARQIDSWPVVA